jgi:hypothetical protein
VTSAVSAAAGQGFRLLRGAQPTTTPVVVMPVPVVE